jgi:uncharacterized membrane protein
MIKTILLASALSIVPATAQPATRAAAGAATMTDVLLPIVVGTVLIALVLDAMALVGWVRSRWR